jgi:hypothetical protein
MQRTLMLLGAAILALAPAVEAGAKDKGKAKHRAGVVKITPGKVKIRIGRYGLNLGINPGALRGRPAPASPPRAAPPALAPASLAVMPEPRPERETVTTETAPAEAPVTVITGDTLVTTGPEAGTREVDREAPPMKLASLPPAEAPPTGAPDITLYAPGDRIASADYVVVSDPARYGLDPYYDYVRIGDAVYRVDPDTKQVIAFMGARSELLR